MAKSVALTDVEIPGEILDPWLTKVQAGSTIATLVPEAPQKFAKGTAFTYDIGEAEYVKPGQPKSGSTITKKRMTNALLKFQKTVRFDQEVQWADEDAQAGIVDQILARIQPALSRALDFATIHAINPIDGTSIAELDTHLSATTLSVYADPAKAAYEVLDAADALVLANEYVPSGAALDPKFAARFASTRTKDGIKLYPDLSLTVARSTLEGHATSVSRTVSATGVATKATNIVGLVGDFSTVRWGVARQLGLELIEYGDPDGLGDLKRSNQVAFRGEVVYGIGIADVDALAALKSVE